MMQPSHPGISMVIRAGLMVMNLETKQQSSQLKTSNSPRLNKMRQVTSRRLFTENSSWQAKQSIPHATVTFYSDCVKMCEDFPRTLATKELAVASHQGIFDQKHDCQECCLLGHDVL
jgi:hypothetical protein